MNTPSPYKISANLDELYPKGDYEMSTMVPIICAIKPMMVMVLGAIVVGVNLTTRSANGDHRYW